MKVKRGDIVETEFCTGPVVAITEHWVIVKDEKRGQEYAVIRGENYIAIPAEFDGIDVPDMQMDVEP